MPHGFRVFLETNNYKEKTIASHTKEIENFFSYLDSRSNITKELFQISSQDLKNYLENQSKQLSASTVYKKLGILKLFFDFLWKTDQVPVDQCMKIQLPRANREYEINLTHDMLYNIQEQVFNSSKYPNRCKLAFVFALYGFKSSELYFNKEDFEMVGDDEVIITTPKRTVYITGIPALILIEYYNTQSLFADTQYFLFSKSTEDGMIVYNKISYVNLNRYLNSIAIDFNLPELNLGKARQSYIYHLAYRDKLSFKEISKVLGISMEWLGEMFGKTKDSTYPKDSNSTA